MLSGLRIQRTPTVKNRTNNIVQQTELGNTVLERTVRSQGIWICGMVRWNGLRAGIW